MQLTEAAQVVFFAEQPCCSALTLQLLFRNSSTVSGRKDGAPGAARPAGPAA
jgi:hypothetical protein